MNLHNELPPVYKKLLHKLKGQNILGIKMTDSLVLEGLAIVAWNIARQYSHSPSEAVRRIENLILANLAAIWTFKLLNDPRFPNYSHIEALRWHLGHFSEQIPADENEDWKYILRFNKVNSFHSITNLETQLGARIGKCSTYTITLGVILCACRLVEDLHIVGSQGHAWVHCLVKGESDHRHIDLSLRSHGELEEDKKPWHYKKLMEDPASVKHDLLDLDDD